MKPLNIKSRVNQIATARFILIGLLGVVTAAEASEAPNAALDIFQSRGSVLPILSSQQKWIDARYLLSEGKLAGELESFFRDLRIDGGSGNLSPRAAAVAGTAIHLSDNLRLIVSKAMPLDRNGRVTDAARRLHLIEEVISELYDCNNMPKKEVFDFFRDNPGDDRLVVSYRRSDASALSTINAVGDLVSRITGTVTAATVKSKVRALVIYSVAYLANVKVDEWYRNRFSESLRLHDQPNQWIQPKTYAKEKSAIRPPRVYLDPRAMARLLVYKGGLENVYNYAGSQAAYSYSVAASKVGDAGFARGGAAGEKVARQILGLDEMAEGKAEKRFFCALTWAAFMKQSYLSVGLNVSVEKQAMASEVANTTPDQIKAGAIKFNRVNIYPMPQYLITNDPDRSGHATGLLVNLDAATMNYRVTRVSFNNTYAEFDPRGYPDTYYAQSRGYRVEPVRFATHGYPFSANDFLASRPNMPAGLATSCAPTPVGASLVSRRN